MARKVGIIGLGCIGRGMARNLLKAGFKLMAYDIFQKVVDEAVEAGAEAAANAKEVGERSEVVISIVNNSSQTEEVVFGPEGLLAGMHPGSVIIVSSTISPTLVRKVAEAANKKGVTVLDAPVSGGNNGAEAGTLTLMVGGPKRTFEEVKDVLEAIGKYIVHVSDEVGTGLIVKLTNQIVTHVTVVAIAEGLTFGAKAGVDPDILFEVLSRCTANCYMWQDRVPSILKRDFTCRGSLDIQVKDLGICLEMGKEMSFPLFLSAAAQQVYLMSQSEGFGKEDLSAVIKIYEKYAKLQVRGSGEAKSIPESVPNQ